MQVNDLELRSFRNYRRAGVSFAPGINVISGPNAQGKTNLLEAVFLLTGGKSFRTRFDRELIAFDSDEAKINSTISAYGMSKNVEICLYRARKKSILVNNARRNSTELSNYIKAVLFCPDDLDIIKDGAAARRKLMDMAISQLRPGYGRLMSEYSKLYENKTRILKDYRDDRRMLDTLEEFSYNLCLRSARIARYRAGYVRRLNAAAGPIHRDFSGSGEELSLSYRTVSSVSDPEGPEKQLFEEIWEHQKSHLSAELASGQCLTGIHKDDIEIEINGRSARSFASQGQTRTAALSMKLGEREIFLEETGEYPVLLLDDVLSELDSRRQEFVLNRIGGGQTLISCCEDEQIVRKTGGKVIFIDHGEVRQ